MFKPNYTITSEILTAISEISSIKTIVERSRVLPLNEAQLKRQALIRMVHTSTSIEGNKLAEYQVDKVLSGMSIAADQKSIQEVKNYQAALKELDSLTEYKSPITITQILNLHKILMSKLIDPEKTGSWRSGDIYVIDDLGDGREHLRYEGPEAQKVPFLINELLLWLIEAEKEKLHPILRAGILHLQFVTIHPFADGNGRMARLLSNLVLYKSGWDFRKILVLEDFYNKNRQDYYNAENEVQGTKYHEGEDITPWLDYFVTGFLIEARKVVDAVNAIGFNLPSDKDSQIYLNGDEVKIMDFLSTTGRITSDDVMEVLHIAKRTAQLKLKTILEKGLIQPQGKGPSTFYILKN